MARLRIDLAYNGKDFHGWAVQPDRRTVQGEIETALARILRGMEQPPHLTVAGRTDAGVHASHQVCHLDVSEAALKRCVGHMNTTPVEALTLRLSRMLPDDVAIHRITVAPAGFDARFSALERTYVYRICDDAFGWDPRQRDYVWRIDKQLDIDAMNAASHMMLGLHDFGSFAIANPGGTTIREVKVASWHRVQTHELVPSQASYSTPEIEGGLLCFTIVADAFARNMVRSLVGACVQLGLHKRSVDWFAQKMAEPLREGSTGPIAPQGLTLEHVEYPADGELAARAERIRAKRTLETL